MSFGSSGAVRFETKGGTGGKPLIFWEEQESRKKSKKKFNYKEKGVKIPLRKSIDGPNEEQENNKPKGLIKEQANKKNAVKKTNSTALGKTTNSSKNNATGKVQGKDHKLKQQKDTVTLTQGQFEKILETIGELSVLAEDKENKDIPSQQTIQPSNNNVTSLNLGDLNSYTEAAYEGPLKPVTPAETPVPQNKSLTINNNQPKVNTSLDLSSPRYPDPRSIPSGPVTGNTRNSTLGIPPAHMTKAEKKRLEWERQKAENEEIKRQAAHTQKLHADVNIGYHRQALVLSDFSAEPVSTTNTQNIAEIVSDPPRPAVQDSIVEPIHIPGLSPNIQTTANHFNGEGSNLYVPQQQQLPTNNLQLQNNSNNSVPPVSKPPLSKAELKRLQWEKEKAEMRKVEEFDPWGRPGAGAPVTGSDGKVLTDYSTRKNEIIRQSYEASPRQQLLQNQTTRNTVQIPVQQQQQFTQHFTPQQLQPVTQQQQPIQQLQPSHLQVDTSAPPAAIRSSFNFGLLAPDENKYQSVKERERQQWIADLERQREEDRLRKLEKQQKEHELDLKDAIAAGYKPSVVQQPQPTGAVPDTNQQYFNPQTTATLQHNKTEDTDDQVTFIRGQNAFIDPLTKKEMEAKRRKQLEYQDFIKQQMDEREKQKKEEREKKWREELEEEKRLQKERDEIQAQLDREQGRIKEKQEIEKKRVEILKIAMDQEKERSEWEKHEKRLMRLKKGGHDTSSLHANFQSKHTPRGEGATSVVTIAPSYVPGLGGAADFTPRPGDNYHTSYPRDNAPSQLNSYPSPAPMPPESHRYDPYTENRVLTPSLYRSGEYRDNAAAIGGGREFGVQADLIKESASRESTEIEFKGPLKKKVRVKSAAEAKAKAANKKVAQEKKTGFGSTYTRSNPPPKSAPVTANEASFQPNLKPILKKKTVPISKRPAWGAPPTFKNDPNKKKVLKQSERDPYYEEKKKRSDSNKAIRQKLLLELAKQEAPTVYQKSTAATRARSRSRGPDDDDYNDMEYFTQPGAVHVATTNVITGERVLVNNPSKSPTSDIYSQYERSSRKSRMDGAGTSNRNNTKGRSNSPPVPAIKHRLGVSAVTDERESPHKSHNRHLSPPITALNHRLEADYDHDTVNASQRSGAGQSTKNRYNDRDVVGAPVQNGEFVPFIRSTNVLDPAYAEDPMPMSREPSVMTKARQAYIQEHEPAKYGTVMENFEDSRILETVPRQIPPHYDKNPITNPSLVKDHPSQRQNKILQQLSDLRKGLMQKQRELEVSLPPEEVVG